METGLELQVEIANIYQTDNVIWIKMFTRSKSCASLKFG